MKKLFLVLMMSVMISGITCAQVTKNDETRKETNEQKVSNAPYMEFDKLVHDYGDIEENADGRCVFVLTNTGREPLILTNVRSTCGCTVPKWEKIPILPGQSSEIEVKYSTNRIGRISKSVTVISNAENNPVVLKLAGQVYKKGQMPAIGNNIDNNSTPKVNTRN